MKLIYQILMAFGSMALLDLIWVKYTHATVQRRAIAAGIWAMGIAFCVAVVTLNYVNNQWMIIPTVAGSFVGTYLAVKFEPKVTGAGEH